MKKLKLQEDEKSKEIQDKKIEQAIKKIREQAQEVDDDYNEQIEAPLGGE